MSGFIVGADRQQATMFPELLEDYVDEQSAVRVIEVFVDEIDLLMLGFKTVSADTGRPGYHPATMLKLFIYGYMNRVQSSHRLEKEANRNIELMWLTGRLAPDFKTIADFRKDNGKAIQKVCREFVLLCQKLNLFKDAFVAIDGSKFKALNNRDRNFTKAKLQRRLEQIDESIARYLLEMESLDRQEAELADDKSQRLAEKIEILKGEIAKLKKHEAALLAAADQQVSLTDPDARSMATSGRGSGMVGYNVQAAVDAKHHLIVTHQVTNKGSDRAQLSPMAEQAKQALGVEEIEAVADRGYFSGEQIKACEDGGITTYLPKPNTSNNRAKGLFDKRDFIYRPEDDEYECPASERLTKRTTSEEKGLTIHRYWASVCGQCALKQRCTVGKERRVRRGEHETVIDRLQTRLDHNPHVMRVRRQTVEHPFGTIKDWMGPQHFKTRTLKRVSTEMSLHVLAYNLKRVISLFGVAGLIAKMQAV
ncbi:MAG: IS1182 family transposase [Gammaproteobacteria bacterium]|nr:IS1182 family transposase [Gammaproteobacteria bacterium]